jgi:hypothetical protein
VSLNGLLQNLAIGIFTMQISKKLLLSSCLVALFASTGYAQNQVRDGALMGGVAGALLGGVIGHQNHETTEGALIGGAVGALAGGAIGNHRQQVERQQYYAAQPHYHYPTTYYEQRTYVPVQQIQPTRVVTRRPVTTAEVINMTRSGVSDAVIVAHIQTNGVAMRPDVNDVILMNQEGVSDYVVTAMQQNGNVYRQPATVVRTYQQPVVVQEQVIVHPQPVYHTHSRPAYRPYYAERRGF